MVLRETDKNENDSLWPEIWKDVESVETKRKAKVGYVVFTSLILRIKNSRKLWKKRVESWRIRCQHQCLAEPDAKSTRKPVAFRTIVRQNTHASLKPTNLRESVWKELSIKGHEDHIAVRGINSLNHYNLVHKFIPMPKAMQIPDAKAAVDKEWEKLEKIPAWSLTKVRSKSEVIDEARTTDAKVHFASLMDICHLKNAGLETKHQKYKGRVVLRGDMVKHDSGSYAAITEQGSSASQMTAAKVMDIKSRMSGCAGQAADAVSAYTQVKMEDAPKIMENSRIGMSRHLDSSTTTQMA